MNFRLLEAFHAVMISGSASRAAELLQVTQPAVSRAIADLERSTGFALFDRVRGRLVPTPEGQLFFTDVSESFAGLDRLRMSAARIRDYGSGHIRIASLAALGSTLVPRAIRAFRTQHPDIAITLQITSSAQVRELVVNGQFGVGLAADEVDLSGVDHRVFSSARALCAMPPDHPLAHRRVIHAQDLHEVPFLALAPEDQARARMFQVFAEANVRPAVVVETPFSNTVCALALEGVGIGLVNPGAAEGFAARGLVLLPFEPAVHFKTFLLFRPDTQKAVLIKHLTASLLSARTDRPRPSPAQSRRILESRVGRDAGG